MDLYTKVAYANSRQLTLAYSTSFGLSSRFFSKKVQPHIYAIYGLVRVADEIVDTYRGNDAANLLDELERAVYGALSSGYSTNPLVHAFAQTARQYDIGEKLIAPFFASMRMDLAPNTYSPKNYRAYIHGSAEVVGLMCLRVFCEGDDTLFKTLKDGAASLGAAYQKINFLRDMAADHQKLGRLYFPGVTFDAFDNADKQRIVDDIKKDLAKAGSCIRRLPASSRTATMMSYAYYSALLEKLSNSPAAVLKKTRIRLPTSAKTLLTMRTLFAAGRSK